MDNHQILVIEGNFSFQVNNVIFYYICRYMGKNIFLYNLPNTTTTTSYILPLLITLLTVLL